MLRALLILLSAMAALALGHIVARVVVPDGTAAFANDPQRTTTAVNAYDLAQTVCLRRAVVRWVLPAARVTRVAHAPGHCEDPGPDPSVQDYRATIRVHTLFGIPLSTITATCGGQSISCL